MVGNEELINKVAEWLYENYKKNTYGLNWVRYKSIYPESSKVYRFKSRQLLKELGLTDTQIEALGKEDTRLAVVYKDSEDYLPISESDMAKQFTHIFDGNLSMAQYINLKNQYLSWIKPLVEDMLAQGWCKKVEE